ncbi:MAG: S41 family peptidase [Lishizhenia sp.]
MNTKFIIPLIVALTLSLGIFLGSRLNERMSISSENSPLTSNAQKLNDILTILDREYVDSINKNDLFEEAVSTMLHNLDPHSNYIPANELKALNESIEGKFGGVGVRFSIIRDTLCVTNVIPDSPSERAGILAQDQILAIDGETLDETTISNQLVMDKLKGIEGTDVLVTIYRNGEKIDKNITRGSIPLSSIQAAFMINKEVGYIQLTSFSLTSANEFYKEAMRLKVRGMKKLIFDLRFNGGGVLGGAVQIADMFLEKGVEIVSTKGKNQPTRVEYSINNPIMNGIDLAVLINSSSASASEIVAGAIQDNDRGIIIGRRSFGKGLVQQDMQLKDKSNLRLTIARYYTPTGRSIQRPYAEGYEEYMLEEQDRYRNGELYAPDSTLMVDSLKYYTPKGKVVYGGGGIMPDVFVPFDTSGTSYYLTQMQYANVFGDFAFDYVKARPQLKTQYKNYVLFDKNFIVDEKLLNELMQYALNYYEIEKNFTALERGKERFKIEIKTRIASQIWLENGAQYVRMKNDSEIQKAIEVLQ